MRMDHPLDDFFRSRSHVRVLRALEQLPDGLAVSAREVARRSGLSHPTALSVLGSLTDQGIVLRRVAPRVDAFELNRQHVLAERLRVLFEWEGQLRGEFLGFLRKEIERKARTVAAAYLFGSATRGEMLLASDIDLAVVCSPAQAEEIEGAMGRVADAVRYRFGNRLSLIIGLSPVEQLGQAGRKGHRLWARILKEGIPVIEEEPIRAIGSPKKQVRDG